MSGSVEPGDWMHDRGWWAVRGGHRPAPPEEAAGPRGPEKKKKYCQPPPFPCLPPLSLVK